MTTMLPCTFPSVSAFSPPNRPFPSSRRSIILGNRTQVVDDKQPSILSFKCCSFLAGRPLQDVFGRSLPSKKPLNIMAAATKKADSSAKRARQAEKSRIYNKSRKSEVRTRMKKVFLTVDGLKKQSEPSKDNLGEVESLIAKAYSVIDKAVKVGSIHRNTGVRRKSRLARVKKTMEIQLGWYTPASVA